MSNIPYTTRKVFRTYEFEHWLGEQPVKLRRIIKSRLDLIEIGHFGDHKRFDELIELRWKNGTRVYCFEDQGYLFVVLVGGNKNGQDKDIKKAQKIQAEIINGTRVIHKP